MSGNAEAFRQLFPESVLRRIFHLILSAWSSMETPAATELENAISRSLLISMRNEIKTHARRPPFLIDRKILIDPTDPKDPSFEIDLRFQRDGNSDLYFSVEGKRLNVLFPSGFNSLATEYAIEGMDRYINGSYSRGLPAGAMAGYVMDGQLDKAMHSVRTAMTAKASQLRMTSSDFEDCEFAPNHPSLKKTLHSVASQDFVVYHVFLTVPA